MSPPQSHRWPASLAGQTDDEHDILDRAGYQRPPCPAGAEWPTAVALAALDAGSDAMAVLRAMPDGFDDAVGRDWRVRIGLRARWSGYPFVVLVGKRP